MNLRKNLQFRLNLLCVYRGDQVNCNFARTWMLIIKLEIVMKDKYYTKLYFIYVVLYFASLIDINQNKYRKVWKWFWCQLIKNLQNHFTVHIATWRGRA